MFKNLLLSSIAAAALIGGVSVSSAEPTTFMFRYKSSAMASAGNPGTGTPTSPGNGDGGATPTDPENPNPDEGEGEEPTTPEEPRDIDLGKLSMSIVTTFVDKNESGFADVGDQILIDFAITNGDIIAAEKLQASMRMSPIYNMGIFCFNGNPGAANRVLPGKSLTCSSMIEIDQAMVDTLRPATGTKNVDVKTSVFIDYVNGKAVTRPAAEGNQVNLKFAALRNLQFTYGQGWKFECKTEWSEETLAQNRSQIEEIYMLRNGVTGLHPVQATSVKKSIPSFMAFHPGFTIGIAPNGKTAGFGAAPIDPKDPRHHIAPPCLLDWPLIVLSKGTVGIPDLDIVSTVIVEHE